MGSDYKKRVEQYFDDWAEGMVTDRPEPYIVQRLDMLLGLCRPGMTVLEAGCGNGNNGLSVAASVGRFIGLDLSADMLRRFRRRAMEADLAGVELAQGDLTAIPLAADTCDLAFCYSTLYYVREADRVIAELARVLKPQGLAVVEFANGRSLGAAYSKLRYNVPHFFQTPGEMAALLDRADLEIIDHRRFQAIPNLVIRGGLRRWYQAERNGRRSWDERLSGSWPLRGLAHKHLITARKK